MMGGYGSTRWLWHTKKTAVENCHKLTIFSFKHCLRSGYVGSITWYRGERKTGNIGYRVLGGENPTAVKLFYTITWQSGEKTDVDYEVRLTTTPLPWGGVRYWFICPLVKSGIPCNRRIGCLYLPPSGDYFGCRHCYELTYRSCQESHQFDTFMAGFAASMQDRYPGITGKDVQAMFDGKTTDNLNRITLERLLKEWENLPDPYADYLTADEIAEQSDLSHDDINRLHDVRLLVPDRDGKYRPKLAGWAKKLAYLLGEGWELAEIKRWAKGRFQTGDPKKWPPDRERWRIPPW
jgi:hypothetical protein